MNQNKTKKDKFGPKVSKLKFDKEAKVYYLDHPYELNKNLQKTNIDFFELKEDKKNSKKSENNINNIKLNKNPKEDLIEDMDNYVGLFYSKNLKSKKSKKNKKDNVIKKIKK